ncbi:hypothetical protein GCM10020358_25070 [Amorphoplanes nipponensis]|uniref:Pyrrolo-quinoline quinone repeat domain-containing protein n=1 Tax=Actinoplanes nipponensis TaxID=135950 RepID=A0A919JQD2_9ACTN|nr:PQQ-binding-like beta-propeller repeat protein [Actinoplanes nipponensis]GIE53386.1 hypothetical protein Ani05nite_69200 [Actinoplanes nipponensis]
MAVIELGLVHSGGGEEADDPPRRPPGRRDLRRVLVAAVTALCVLTVTGSARPDPRGLPQLWSIAYEQGTGAFMLNGDSVYVLTQPGADQLAAYDLRTGAKRWSRPSPDEASWLSEIAAGALLLPAGMATAEYQEADGSTVTRDLSRDTAAVDAATGRQLWRQAGELITVAGDRALLGEWNADGDEITTFRVVRVRDGGTVWSRPGRDVDSWVIDTAVGATRDRLVTLTAGGRAEVVDLADGSLLTTGNLPDVPQPRQQDDYTAMTLDGRQLYLDRSRDGRMTVTAFDTETLRQLWQTARAAPGGIYGCGPVVCVTGPDGTEGRDRRTGRPRWRIPGAANAFPLRNGLLLVDDDETGARHRLVDSATGRQIADLGTAAPVWDFRLDGTPYVLAHPRTPGDLMLISRVDQRTGETLLRGTIPAVQDFGCQSKDALVVCATRDSRLTVTDVG